MSINEAREIVQEACVELVKAGLVARTWGNISARVDDEVFVITPSGRRYEDLTVTDMVPVKISDLTHEGSIKPSSEKGLHAEIYKQNKGVNAVIHTHQTHASTVAAARKDITGIGKKHSALLGTTVRVAAYGLPGTGKLARATAEALGASNAALMANHGAVCVGKKMRDAFAVARALEEAAEEFIARSFLSASGQNGPFSLAAMHTFYLNMMAER
ncbi:MAG TPA: class II aldolase/adducin family protein [Spirochaetota bacterium]|nr:class II aldolase/adducin family protein [Spirochaetota bacterium]HPI90333.1 class II aldolase/adducin family protein [Spirochaetota bacterium]HPR49422.1 class II aldolase/adducin family protein [Spirochaetota bacterium]